MIKLYLANLGKYNEGELVGKWVELPIDEDELNQAMVDIKLGYFDEDDEYVHGYEENNVVYEEFAIHDYETDLGIKIEEHDNVEQLNELAELAEKNEEDFIALAEVVDISEIESYLRNGDYSFYNGMDLEDVARMMVDEGLFGEISPSIINYIDYEAIARDLSYDNYKEVSNGVICLY